MNLKSVEIIPGEHPLHLKIQFTVVIDETLYIVNNQRDRLMRALTLTRANEQMQMKMESVRV
jgi:hypothetical protein